MIDIIHSWSFWLLIKGEKAEMSTNSNHNKEQS